VIWQWEPPKETECHAEAWMRDSMVHLNSWDYAYTELTPEAMDDLCIAWLKYRQILKPDYDLVCRTLDEDSRSREFWANTDGWYGYHRLGPKWSDEDVARFNEQAITIEHKQVVRYATEWKDET